MMMFLLLLVTLVPNADGYEWRAVRGGDQVALYKDGVQVGNYSYDWKIYRPLKDGEWGAVTEPPQQPPARPSSAMSEVNAARARRGLPPFVEDPGLTQAAQGAAEFRAARGIAGHTHNDFAFVPPGTRAAAAGCAAWEASWGWGSCCTYEQWRYAGAAVAVGRDGRRYMHLYVR